MSHRIFVNTQNETYRKVVSNAQGPFMGLGIPTELSDDERGELQQQAYEVYFSAADLREKQLRTIKLQVMYCKDCIKVNPLPRCVEPGQEIILTGINFPNDVSTTLYAILWDISNNRQTLFTITVDGIQTEHGFKIDNKKVTVDSFKGYDIVLLGDIHVPNNSVSGVDTIKYPGSLITQNHSESIYPEHGILVWDVSTKSSTFVHIENAYGYGTIDIEDGKIVSNNVVSARIDEDIIKFTTKNSKVIKVKFNHMFLFDENIEGLPQISKTINKGIVYDYAKFDNVNQYRQFLIQTEDDFVNQVWIDGNKLTIVSKTDDIREDIPDYMIRFRVLELAAQWGYKGKQNGIYHYRKELKIPRFKKLNIKMISRDIIKTKMHIYAAQNNLTFVEPTDILLNNLLNSFKPSVRVVSLTLVRRYKLRWLWMKPSGLKSS